MRGFWASGLACAAIAGGSAGSVAGDTVEIESTFSGGLYADGHHFPGFMNYYVGYAIPSSPIERRNYFVFDLTGVTGTVVSAKLKLYNPGDPDLFEPCGYISPDPTEDYLLTGSPFPWTAFADAFSGAPIPPATISAMYGTLGTSMPFGVATISGDSCGSDVVIEFDGTGVAEVNDALGDHIAMGGRLTDLLPEPGTPPAELAFAYTDIPNDFMPMPRLELEIVPEPGAALLLVLGAGVARRRR